MLSHALNLAVKHRRLPVNVAALAERPRVPDNEPKTFSREQLRALIAAAEGDRLEALIVLAASTGMRQGELLGLRWRYVNLAAGTLRVAGSLQRIPQGGWVPEDAVQVSKMFSIMPPKTKRSRRTVPLAPEAVRALTDHAARQQKERDHAEDLWTENDLVFANEIGGPTEPTNMLKRTWGPVLTRAGLPRIPFHSFRHSAATILLEDGVHPSVVAALLGHARSSTTLDLFSHVVPGLAETAAETLRAGIWTQLSSDLSSKANDPPEAETAKQAVN